MEIRITKDQAEQLLGTLREFFRKGHHYGVPEQKLLRRLQRIAR